MQYGIIWKIYKQKLYLTWLPVQGHASAEQQ
jgi:hypothetical protein